MGRLGRVLVLSVLLALAGVACSSDGDAPRGRVGIGMKDNFFTKDVVRIQPGDTVRWSNDGDTVHNAVAVDEAWSVPTRGGEDDPDDDGLLVPGQTVTTTFDEPGVYEYYCTIHGTADGVGMFAVLLVGDVEYSPLGEAAPPEPVRRWTGETRRVPDDHPTIQNAVDAAAPGDLVLVSPAPEDDAHLAPDGRYVYKEQVDVSTPYITIRGTDRNTVIVDGEFERFNAINVAGADGVAVENLTVRHATTNGLFFTSLRGYRASYVTAYRNGVYGIYAFDATDGLFEHSYASSSPDAGYYIGQCDPCEAIVSDVVAEGNGLGYSGTNASGVVLIDSVWRDNAAGIVPNSLDTELLPPTRDVTIVGNVVVDNSNADAPALEIQTAARGAGIVLGGVRDAHVARNLVVGHEIAGIAVVPLPDQNIWFSGRNEVRDNVVRDSGIADVVLAGPGLGGDCFAGNELSTTLPVGLEAFHGCDGGLRLPFGSQTSATMFLVGRFADAAGGSYPSNDWTAGPVPPDQPQLPDGEDAPVRPAVDVYASFDLDLDAIAVPDGSGVAVDVPEEFTVFGVPVAAGFWPVLFGLYGYLLPFVLLAAWTAIALWDIARREDLSRGAAIGWIAAVLVVPFLGPIAYHVASRSPIPAWLRGAFVGGGLLAYVLVLAVAAVTGGIV
jgi:plastocyanin